MIIIICPLCVDCFFLFYVIDEQVETVNQVYMAVSGAPEYTREHARNVIDLSLEFAENIKDLQRCSIQIQIKIGIGNVINY